MKQRTIAATLLAAATTLPMAAQAQSFTAELTNLTHGTYFTPLLVAAHIDGSHVFEVGHSATASLQAMAEGGDLSGLVTDLAGIGATYIDDPAAGLLAPGASTTADLNTTDTANTQLSIVAMLLPTNDGFVGLDAITLPPEPGVYTYYLNAYDAGTEANDEIINGAGAPGEAGVPAAPGEDGGTGGTGAAGDDANPTVHVHRGVLGDNDPNGGVSDLDNTIHRWLNPVAKLVLTVN